MEIDASDYGIGGFLFQVNPETEEKVPIQCQQISYRTSTTMVNT